jgi:reductive dehalogenase
MTEKNEDAKTGFVVDDKVFHPFRQKNDVFRRSWWDDRIRNEKTQLFYETYRQPLKTWRQSEGFSQKDYALRNASWHVSDIFTELKENEDRREGFSDAFTLHRERASQQIEFASPGAAAEEIKRVALALGAGMVGITGFDERWQYSQKFSDMSQEERPVEVDASTPNVIVIALPMDYELIRSVPSALSGAATGLGYSHDALVSISLAQYILNLGYKAVATMNDSSLAIPYAIQAGLGEYGRNGLLITPKFGPRVRLAKIYTDMPLEWDEPKTHGVRSFCDQCDRCAEACPVNAISFDKPSYKVHNQSNIIGVEKWTVDGEKCFSFWSGQNTECSICIRVCPYNKDYSKWYHRVGIRLAATRLRGLMLWLDIRLGYGQRNQPDEWWQGRSERFSRRILHMLSGKKRFENS